MTLAKSTESILEESGVKVAPPQRTRSAAVRFAQPVPQQIVSRERHADNTGNADNISESEDSGSEYETSAGDIESSTGDSEGVDESADEEQGLEYIDGTEEHVSGFSGWKICQIYYFLGSE